MKCACEASPRFNLSCHGLGSAGTADSVVGVPGGGDEREPDYGPYPEPNSEGGYALAESYERTRGVRGDFASAVRFGRHERLALAGFLQRHRDGGITHAVREEA